MKKTQAVIITIFVLAGIFIYSSAFAWKYRFESVNGNSKNEVLLNSAGKIDNVSGSSLVVDDSLYEMPKNMPVRVIEDGSSYAWNLKEGLYVGLVLDKDRKLVQLWVFSDPENYKKMKAKELEDDNADDSDSRKNRGKD